MRNLLGGRSIIGANPNDHFDTLSAGVTMMTLAARADGANILSECVTDGGTVNVPSNRVRSTRHPPLVVSLWLTKLSPEMARELGAVGEVWDIRSVDSKIYEHFAH